MEKVERIIRKPEVLMRVGLSDPSIYRREKLGLFPKRLELGRGTVGWLESEIEAWIQEKADARK